MEVSLNGRNCLQTQCKNLQIFKARAEIRILKEIADSVGNYVTVEGVL